MKTVGIKTSTQQLRCEHPLRCLLEQILATCLLLAPQWNEVLEDKYALLDATWREIRACNHPLFHAYSSWPRCTCKLEILDSANRINWGPIIALRIEVELNPFLSAFSWKILHSPVPSRFTSLEGSSYQPPSNVSFSHASNLGWGSVQSSCTEDGRIHRVTSTATL